MTDIEDQSRARKSAMTLALVIATASVVAIAGWYIMKQATYWQWYFSAVISTGCVLLLRFYRSPVWMSATVSLLVTAVVIFANTLTTYELVKNGYRPETFGAFKLTPIAVAIIALSPVWISYLIIAVCSVGPFVLYYLIIPAEMRTAISPQEPWVTVIYSIVAFFVLRHRLKGIKLERMAARLKAERRALDDLARIFLGLRDLTNTPLQSIELTAKLLRTNHLTSTEASEHLERSLIRLRELSQILTSYENDVDWTNTEASFDAVALLQQKINEMRKRT